MLNDAVLKNNVSASTCSSTIIFPPILSSPLLPFLFKTVILSIFIFSEIEFSLKLCSISYSTFYVQIQIHILLL